MDFSTKQINVFMWVLFAIVLFLFLAFVLNQSLGIETVWGITTQKHCVGSVCAW